MSREDGRVWLPGWSEGAVGGDGAAEGGTPIGKLALPLRGSSCGPSAACEGVRGYPAAWARAHRAETISNRSDIRDSRGF